MKARALKIVGILCAPILAIMILSASLILTETGRKFLVSGVEKHFAQQNIIVKIRGINNCVTRIDEIYVKTPSNVELIFSNIKLQRENVISRSSAHIEKFVLNGSKEKADLREKISSIIPLLENIRKLILHFTLDEGSLNFGDVSYTLNDLKYDSTGSKDKASCKINNTHVLNISWSWNIFGCYESHISFKDVFGFCGILQLTDLYSRIAKYDLFAKNDQMKIACNGSYSDFISNIDIDSAVITHKNTEYKCRGNASFESKHIKLKSEIPMNDYINDLPEKIKRNFENIVSICEVNYRFNKDEKSTAAIQFTKNKKLIGDLQCTLLKNKMSIIGNISWIEMFGFKAKKMKCSIENFKKATIEITGKNFSINSACNLVDGEIAVENVTLAFPEYGYIKTDSRFILNKANEIPFEFDFSNLDFLRAFFPVSGDITGSGKYYNDGIATLNSKSQKISWRNHTLHNLQLAFNENDASIIATAKKMRLFNSAFSDLRAELKQDLLQISGKTNNDFAFSAHGIVSDSRRKISFKKCSVKSPHVKIDIKAFELNFLDKQHKIHCEISDGRSSKGTIDAQYNVNVCDIALESIDTSILKTVIDRRIPECNVNAKLKLCFAEEFASGSGTLSIKELISPKNTINATISFSNDGLKINSSLMNGNEFLKADIYAPFFMKNDWTAGFIPGRFLNCHITANTKIEHLLELSDRRDARGQLLCDVNISGSTTNPNLKGNIIIQDVYFVVDDIVLRNGAISLKCEGDSINVGSAKFIDGKNNKLQIVGSGKFFFDNYVPNIEANLKLNFGNFTLFDSDKMVIAVDGPGAITGTINDLLISGNVKLPLCKILRFDISEENENDDPIIENAKSLRRKSSKKEVKDFCRYDVKMLCPKVEVVGKTFDINLLGNLNLLTYENKTTIAGCLKLSEGRVYLFGKRMRMSKGSATFSSETPFDPFARFLCENTFGDMTAYLEIVNKPGKGVFMNLYSRPSYSQDVILSNIMFGKSTKYLSVTEAAQLAHAVANMKSNGYIFSILNAFQNIGIVDNISLTSGTQESNSLYSNEQNSNNKQGAMNISAGKYIHDNIYVSVNKNADNERASFDVDLSLTDSLSVKANTKGEAGISWRYRY